MSNAIHPAVPAVVESLNAAEISADAQLSSQAELLASIIHGQAKAGLPFGAMQGAIADASEAITLSVRSRYHIARSHQRLLDVALKHELVPVGHGDIFPWCEGASESLPVTALRSVA